MKTSLAGIVHSATRHCQHARGAAYLQGSHATHPWQFIAALTVIRRYCDLPVTGAGGRAMLSLTTPRNCRKTTGLL